MPFEYFVVHFRRLLYLCLTFGLNSSHSRTRHKFSPSSQGNQAHQHFFFRWVILRWFTFSVSHGDNIGHTNQNARTDMPRKRHKQTATAVCSLLYELDAGPVHDPCLFFSHLILMLLPLSCCCCFHAVVPRTFVSFLVTSIVTSTICTI